MHGVRTAAPQERQDRRRRGFSLTELVVTLVILGILSAIGAYTFSKTSTTAIAQGDQLYLGTAEIAATNLASADGGAFPSDLATTLSASGVTITSGASTGPSDISAGYVSGTQAVLVDLDSTGSLCNVLVVNLAGKATWGLDSSVASGACSASAAASAINSITSTNSANPSKITLGS